MLLVEDKFIYSKTLSKFKNIDFGNLPDDQREIEIELHYLINNAH